MLTPEEYPRHDAISLASLLQTGEVSPAELLESAIARAEALNPGLNAIVHRGFEEARAAAVAMGSVATDDLSSLQGVPFLIKDMAAVADWPQTHGSRLFADQVAETDSLVARRFREAGLLLFGKTNIPELCLTITTESALYGPCQNPEAPGHSPGGSSGGSAAAVAAGIVPAAHGSDGGGSIRIPAACCGLVGLKPSRGLTVVENDIGSAWSGMSVNHVLTRSVRDSAAFLDVLRLEQPHWFALPAFGESCYQSHNRQPGRLRIALQRQHPGGAVVHDDCLAALDHTVKLCEDAGMIVEEQRPPVDYQALGQAMGTLINVHVAQILKPALGDDGAAALDQSPLEEATRRMAARGLTTTATDYLEALDTLKQAEWQMQAFHRHHDVVLSPVLTHPAAELGWLDMNGDIREYAQRFNAYSGFTALYNGTGQPSLSMPMHRNPSGHPVGVMFSAAWGQDHRLLQLAALLESVDDSGFARPT
ncbi:MAG: amidase [Pseudomonadota bacterium]